MSTYSIRTPTADLPNVAAFLGGMVAQEAIKIITKQYVPTNGYCVVDLVDSWTGVVGADGRGGGRQRRLRRC